MRDQAFLPVMDPYQATVLVGYLAHAFNGRSVEVPPYASPLWPIACRVVEAMHADHYHLGAYRDPTLPYIPRVAGDSPPEHSVTHTGPRQPLNTVVQRAPGVMHSATVS